MNKSTFLRNVNDDQNHVSVSESLLYDCWENLKTYDRSQPWAEHET